jgi:predicted metalloprotease with PDZ domain
MRISPWKQVAGFFALTLLLATGTAAAEPVRYELSFEHPNTHLLDITIHAGGLDGKQVRFAIPDWTPGGYGIQNFAEDVQRFSATDSAGHAADWRKTDSQTWQIELHGAASVIVRYQVYANGHGATYNEQHAALQGPAIWMYVVDGKTWPTQLKIDTASLPSDWKIATGMKKTGENMYAADDYDWFADAPIEAGKFVERDFTALGTTYHVIVHDELGSDEFPEFIQGMQRVIEKGIVPVFAPVVGGNTPAPFSDYYFIIHINGPWRGTCGGLEHLNSTSIGCFNELDDRRPTNRHFILNTYQNTLDVAAHEFFHAWNVKRLRPRELGPFDYTQMVHTPSLWISEGVTDYYAAVALARTGIFTPQDYLDHMGRVITALEQSPGRKERSIADTSWDTWFGGGGGGFGGGAYATNLGNTNYSYYDGGNVIGLLLDLEIRHATENRKSLDDWMRLMYQRYALPKPGFEPGDAVRAASEIAGMDMSDFFARYVTGKDLPPYERDLAYAGIHIEGHTSNAAWLGATLDTDSSGHALITNIIPGSPAEEDGLDRGDVITALDGNAVDRKAFDAALAARHPGDKFDLTVTRFAKQQNISVTSATDPTITYTLKPMDNPTELQKKIYASYFTPQ